MICGDFNSEPTSAVHEFLSTGAIANSRNYPELEVEDGGVRVLARDLRTITHGMELASAMSTVIGREPTFTNYTAKFKGTLDYIWYTPSLLRVMAGANMPDQHELISVSGKGAGLPCVSYPSDHISLCCDVAMVNAPLQ
jgi:CCR4-NOT transcription complex subunit 6